MSNEQVIDPLDAPSVTRAEAQPKPSDNCIVLYDTHGNIRTTIRIDNINQVKDIRVKFNPLKPGSTYMSLQKLKWYAEFVKEYLDDPTIEKIICTPEISDLVTYPNKVTFSKSLYKSYIMIEHVATEIQVSPLEDFSIVEQIIMLHDTYKEDPEITFTKLRHRQKYFFRIRYGGAGYFSAWSNALSFTCIKATIPTPTIDPILDTDIVFNKLNLPIINFRSSPYKGNGVHSFSTIKIYGENLDNKELLLTIQDDKYLVFGSLEKLYPQTLSYGKTYWISISYHNENLEYSEESPKVPFSVNAIQLDPPKDFATFPKSINTSNPLLSFNSNLTYKFQNRPNMISIDDISNITWNIFKNDGTRVYQEVTKDVSLSLPVGTLQTNTHYYVTIFYTHKTLGNSPTATFRFSTNATYKPIEDTLPQVDKVYNNCAYFGEILQDQCMDDHVTYLGVFDKNRNYLRYQEVSRNNQLFVCIINTPTDNPNYDFNMFFKPVESVKEEIYKSGLPTPTWLVKYLGLNPNQTGDIGEPYFNLINANTSWLKTQNQKGKILYITKQPIISQVSINDLIKADLYHPRRKTIRVFNRLYYVRILVNTLEQGYDTPDPQHFENKAFNKYFNHRDPIAYGEDKLLEYLITNRIANFSPSDLEISEDAYTELIYTHNKLCGYRAYASLNGYNILPSKVEDPDLKMFSLRVVLEYIPEDEHPLKNISTSLPGNNVPNQEHTDVFGELAFLGIVSPTDFITSPIIDARTDFNSFKSIPILSWLKFYYRGLIYYISLGDAFANVSYNDLLEANLVYPTQIFTKDISTSTEKPGKVIFNDLIFNVSLPNVFDYSSISERVIVEGEHDPITIKRNTNLDLNIAYNSFLSNTLYSVFYQDALKSTNQADEPLTGYKGSYRHYNFPSIVDLSSTLANIQDRFILTQNLSKENNVFVNRSWFLNSIDVIARDTPCNAVIVLSISPTFDNDLIWGY